MKVDRILGQLIRRTRDSLGGVMGRSQQPTDQAMGDQIQHDEQQAARRRILDLARQAAGQPDPACATRDVPR